MFKKKAVSISLTIMLEVPGICHLYTCSTTCFSLTLEQEDCKLHFSDSKSYILSVGITCGKRKKETLEAIFRTKGTALKWLYK